MFSFCIVADNLRQITFLLMSRKGSFGITVLEISVHGLLTTWQSNTSWQEPVKKKNCLPHDQEAKRAGGAHSLTISFKKEIIQSDDDSSTQEAEERGSHQVPRQGKIYKREIRQGQREKEKPEERHYFWVYTCMPYIHVCMFNLCRYTHVYMHVETKLMSDIFLNCFAPYIPRQGLSLESRAQQFHQSS